MSNPVVTIEMENGDIIKAERFALAECTARSDCRAAADAAGYKPHHKPDRQL